MTYRPTGKPWFEDPAALLPQEPWFEDPQPIGEGGLFHSQTELKLYQAMVVEGYEHIYTKLPVILIDRKETRLDPLFAESRHRVWQMPLYIPGQTIWSPIQFVLSRFGIESAQEVLVTFPELVLRDKGIVDIEQMVGAIIILKNDSDRATRWFEVMSVHREPRDAWSMRGDNLNVAVTVAIRIPSSVDGIEDLPIDQRGGFAGL